MLDDTDAISEMEPMPTPHLCPACQIPGHEVCGMDPTCDCCTLTIADA